MNNAEHNNHTNDNSSNVNCNGNSRNVHNKTATRWMEEILQHCNTWDPQNTGISGILNMLDGARCPSFINSGNGKGNNHNNRRKEYYP